MVETELDIFTELVESLGEEEECEHRYHYFSDLHDDGPGIWYLTSCCPGCNEEQVILVCDRFKGRIVSGDKNVQCYSCLEAWPVGLILKSVTRK